MIGVELRLATTADLPGIAAIYNHEVHNGVATFDTESWSEEVLAPPENTTELLPQLAPSETPPVEDKKS